jgi:hypothetical protein
MLVVVGGIQWLDGQTRSRINKKGKTKRSHRATNTVPNVQKEMKNEKRQGAGGADARGIIFIRVVHIQSHSILTSFAGLSFFEQVYF